MIYLTRIFMLPMALKGFRIKTSPNQKDISESQWDTANEAKRKQILKQFS